tara:strand:+ start:3672 stop:4241 length:570 start_codon:yes stop_codon:yes gene_type:complete
MSKIYKNFGVTTDLTEREGKFQDISVTGEKINVSDLDIDIINRKNLKKSDTKFGGKTHLREKVFADFRSSGYTEKLSNFYADTFFDLSKKNGDDPTSYYTIIIETENTFEYKLDNNFVTRETYEADAGNEFDPNDSYRKTKNLISKDSQKIKLNEDTLQYINNTLPKSVSFKVEKLRSSNKFVDPLIRI